MGEQYLRDCLSVVGDYPKDSRRRRVAKLPSWRLLERPWQGLLLVALDEEQIPEDDESATGKSSPRRRNRKSRSRRGVTISKSPAEMLDTPTNLVEDGISSPAYKLASLLIHKTLKTAEWAPELDSEMGDLRDSCMGGVHPVWGEMAEKTPILGQMAAFPVVEPSTPERGDIDQTWLLATRVDPADLSGLANLLALPMPIGLSPAAELALKHLQKTLLRSNKNSGWLKQLPSELLSLEGKGALLSAILLACAGDKGATDALQIAASEVEAASEVISDLVALSGLRSGDNSGWKSAIEMEGLDPLSSSLRVEGWSAIPYSEATEMKVEELETGLAVLEGAGKDTTTLRWAIISSTHSGGDVVSAAEKLSGLIVHNAEQLTLSIKVLSDTEEGDAGGWLAAQLSGMESPALLSIINNESLSGELRRTAAETLRSLAEQVWFSVIDRVIPLYISEALTEELTVVLGALSDGLAQYPWEIIVAFHLHEATSDEDIKNWLHEAHQIAIASMDDVEPHPAITSLSISLLKLLEGSKADLNDVAQKLDKEGFMAFKRCRFSFTDSSTWVTESDSEKLSESVENADLTPLENRLFHTVVENVAFNRSAFLIQQGEGEEERKRIDSFFSSGNIRQRLLEALEEMVLEHTVSLPSLVFWYQNNNPLSVRHTIARAAVNATEGENLAAARAYSQAGNNRSGLDYDQRIPLLRSSLIHFAHAAAWSEAKNLLDSEMALRTALTPTFQLYLEVSRMAAKGEQESATQLVLDSTVIESEVQVENIEGEMKTEIRKEPSLEELDRLMRYSQSRGLPIEPFLGRVRAALTRAEGRGRRRSHVFDVERRYAEALRDGDLSVLYDLASELAEENPLRGLSLLERTLISDKFLQHKKEKLRHSMLGLFRRHHAEIPVSGRRHLRSMKNLKPLVLIDTNILIDALKARIAEALELAHDAKLDLVGHSHYHHMLLLHSNNDRLLLYVPNIAERELKAISADNKRLRSMFGSVHVDDKQWKKVTQAASLEKMVNDLLKSFRTWRPPLGHGEDPKRERKEVDAFLLNHQEVYDKLTVDRKARNPDARRNVIGDNPLPIFPEEGDQLLMLDAANFAAEPLAKIGVIVIASRDSDFTHVTRALEENFGFTVAKSAAELAYWL